VNPDRLQAWRRAGFAQVAPATPPIDEAGGYWLRVLRFDRHGERAE
jgi:hypothetical protein